MFPGLYHGQLSDPKLAHDFTHRLAKSQGTTNP